MNAQPQSRPVSVPLLLDLQLCCLQVQEFALYCGFNWELGDVIDFLTWCLDATKSLINVETSKSAHVSEAWAVLFYSDLLNFTDLWCGTLVNTGVIISPCYAIFKLKSQSPRLTFKTMKSPLTAFRKPHTTRRHFEYHIYFASIFCTHTRIIYESCLAPAQPPSAEQG